MLKRTFVRAKLAALVAVHYILQGNVTQLTEYGLAFIPSSLTNTALRHAEDTLDVRIPMAARALWLIRNGQLTELDDFIDRPRDERSHLFMTNSTIMSLWHGMPYSLHDDIRMLLKTGPSIHIQAI